MDENRKLDLISSSSFFSYYFSFLTSRKSWSQQWQRVTVIQRNLANQIRANNAVLRLKNLHTWSSICKATLLRYLVIFTWEYCYLLFSKICICNYDFVWFWISRFSFLRSQCLEHQLHCLRVDLATMLMSFFLRIMNFQYILKALSICTLHMLMSN